MTQTTARAAWPRTGPKVAPPLQMPSPAKPDHGEGDARAAEDRDYYTYSELAKLLDVKGVTLSDMLKARGKLKLPAYKIAETWRAPKAAMAAWLAWLAREGIEIGRKHGAYVATYPNGTEVGDE